MTGIQMYQPGSDDLFPIITNFRTREDGSAVIPDGMLLVQYAGARGLVHEQSCRAWMKRNPERANEVEILKGFAYLLDVNAMEAERRNQIALANRFATRFKRWIKSLFLGRRSKT